MSETLRPKPRGLSGAGLRYFGLACLALGIAGRCLIQNRMLNMAKTSAQELLALLEKDPDMMGAATVALVLQVVLLALRFLQMLFRSFFHPFEFLLSIIRSILFFRQANMPRKVCIF